MDENGVQWAKLQAEYVNTSITLKALADKYSVPVATVKRISARNKWGEKRRAYAADKREQVTRKLHEKDVAQTVSDIERCCAAACKLIDMVLTAMQQLHKVAYIAHDEQTETKSENTTEQGNTIHTTKTRKLRMAATQGLIDTKRLAEIARALACIKQVLTDNSGNTESTGDSGIIEIVAATLLEPPPNSGTE